MWLLGFLHDIGYNFTERRNLHPEFGGMILTRNNYKYNMEVIEHGTRLEYSKELDYLHFADYHTSPTGEYITYKKRLNSIKERYGQDSEEYKFATQVINRLVKIGLTDELMYTITSK